MVTPSHCHGTLRPLNYDVVVGFHKFTLVAKGADTQPDPSCVSAPLETNVDLFACFAERLFKSSFSDMSRVSN